MIASLLLATAGILFAFVMYSRKLIDPDRLAAKLRPAHTFLLNKWYFDEIYEKWVVIPGLLAFTRIMHWFDAHIIDGAVNGVAAVTRLQSRISGLFDKWVVDGFVNFVGYFVGFLGILLKKTQTGRIQTYIAFVITGVVVLIYLYGILL